MRLLILSLCITLSGCALFTSVGPDLDEKELCLLRALSADAPAQAFATPLEIFRVTLHGKETQLAQAEHDSDGLRLVFFNKMQQPVFLLNVTSRGVMRKHLSPLRSDTPSTEDVIAILLALTSEEALSTQGQMCASTWATHDGIFVFTNASASKYVSKKSAGLLELYRLHGEPRYTRVSLPSVATEPQ